MRDGILASCGGQADDDVLVWFALVETVEIKAALFEDRLELEIRCSGIGEIMEELAK